ncbi:MAG: DUF1302 family protein [Myxococcales bacterium]|nr:DUF1302 family protein [Myxococcales bacterium]
MPSKNVIPRRQLWLIGVLLLSLCARAGGAQDELEDLLEGFEQEEEVILDDAANAEPTFWELDGAVSVSASYAYAHDSSEEIKKEYRGLAVLRTQLSLELDLNLPRAWKARVAGRGFYDLAYAIQGRDKFTRDAKQAQVSEVEFQEVWLQGSLLPQLDLKFGRQIVNWGRSETIRILDILNPLDNREPGLVDIEDLRLPVTMTRLDYFYGAWTLTGIAVHETRFNEDPDFGSEFFPFDIELPSEETPANGGSDTEWAAALTGIFSGWDISLHWARFFDDRPHLELVPLGMGPPTLLLRHSRLTMFGASTNYALGDWLLKAEGAYLNGLEFFVPPPDEPAEKSRFDVLVGIEYAGFRDATVTFELANRHISGYHSNLAAGLNFAQRNSLESSFRYSADFINSRLHLTYLAAVFGLTGDDGGFTRLSLDYELRDALTVGGGLVLYWGGDLPFFEGIRKNDRLFLTAKYSF